MYNQKYLMEDKVKDEDDDPLKDKRRFQSFIIYMFIYMYSKTYLSTPDTVNGIFPLFRIISLSKYSPPINFGSSIVYEIIMHKWLDKIECINQFFLEWTSGHFNFLRLVSADSCPHAKIAFKHPTNDSEFSKAT